MWKRIWQINVPRVVKVFLWKACNNLLPTKEIYFKKNDCSGLVVPFCELDVKNTSHIQWPCPSSNDECGDCLRKISKLLQQRWWFPTYPMWAIWETWEGRSWTNGHNEEVELMVTIARRIWLRRNTVVFGGDLTHPSQLQDGSQKDTKSISDSLKNYVKSKRSEHGIPR